MANETQVKQLLELAEDCTKTPINQLITNADWGTINFEGSRAELDRTFDMLNQFKLLPARLLPDNIIQQIISTLQPLKATLDQIRSFSIEQGNPPGGRDTLVAQFRGQADAFFGAAHLYIPYLAYQKGDVQKNINELTRSVEQASELVVGAKQEIKAQQEEIGNIIVAAREAAASVGVAHFSADFSTEATEREGTAKNWLVATGILALVTLLIAFGVAFIPIDKDATPSQIAQLFTSKIVILGLMFTATIWCGRLYKATKHQATINKHRSNALRTFQAFTKAASDDAARNAVLMETTKSIFAITPSGYLDGEVPSDGGFKIVEVVKNATQVLAATK